MFCPSGEGGILAGVFAVGSVTVTVAVTGSNGELCPLANLLDVLVEAAAEACVKDAVSVDSVEETALPPEGWTS